MHYEENYMTYLENEGCCDAVIFKLRKKRHFIMLTLLSILAIVSLLAGLFNGFILKEYSDLALMMGIFFPSIILVFICVYLAFICGRESFRSSIQSRIHRLSGGRHSRPSQVAQQYCQTDSAARNNWRVRYPPKTNMESLDYPLEARNDNPPLDKVDYNADELVDYCEAKVSRKHIRSFSGSDIPKRMHRNHDSLPKKLEICKFKSRVADDNQNSSTFGGHPDVNQRKEFKRSASDIVNRNRYAKFKEDKCVWNTQALDKLRINIVEVNSLNDAVGKSDFEPNEVVRKPPEDFHPQKNRKSAEKSERSTRLKEYGGCEQRYQSKQQGSVNVVHEEDIRKENCYTKSEIRLYSSSILKPPYECKQILRFSSFQPRRSALKDVRDIASCSSSGDEKASCFSRSDCDTLEMERKTYRLESFPSERDNNRLRRKTIYFPSTSNKESTRPLREYAHEYCKHMKKGNKTSQRSFQRHEENFEHQNDKQVTFRSVSDWIRNSEENM